MRVIKKDGTLAAYDEQKIINACNLAAKRALYTFCGEDFESICNGVLDVICEED